MIFTIKVIKVKAALNIRKQSKDMNFCNNIQSSIIRIKIGSSQTQKARKKVNFIRYIRKADDDSISVAERQKLSPFIIRKARSFFLALTPFTRRAKKFLSLPLGLIWTT